MESFNDLAAEGVGYLDMREYNRARWAWEQSHPAAPFMLWLKVAGHVNFSPDNIRVASSTSPGIPIPATSLAFAEITRLADYLYEQFGDVETAAQDKYGGAPVLLDLAREVSTAYARWPIEEKPHRVNVIPCPGCNMLTLMYRPPVEKNDAVTITCLAQCGTTITGQQFADMCDLMEQETMPTRKLNKRWVTVEDAAELTSKSKDTIWRWARTYKANGDPLVRFQFYDSKKFYNLADIYAAEATARAKAS